MKTALISGEHMLAQLENVADALKSGRTDELRAVTRSAVAEKIRVVANDEREQGERAILNLGHTIGHALESAGEYDTYLHGEAVGLGLLLEHEFGVARGFTDPAIPELIRKHLRALGLPATTNRALLAKAAQFLGTDKKRSGRAIKLPLAETPGKIVIREIAIEELAKGMS